MFLYVQDCHRIDAHRVHVGRRLGPGDDLWVHRAIDDVLVGELTSEKCGTRVVAVYWSWEVVIVIALAK